MRIKDKISKTGAAATLVFLVAGGAFAYTTVEVRADDAVATAAREAQDAARDAVPAMLSYDYESIDSTFPAAAQSLTGAFRDEFTSLGTTVIIPAAQKDSIVTSAQVVESSVVTADTDSVTLLMFLNQNTTSATQNAPRLDGSRVRVTLSDVDGRWLVSDLKPV